jgi:hypothetical protein
MNKKQHINKLIDEAINSADDITRAKPMPFLLTRINARLNKKKENFWEKAVWIIGRPAIVIPGLVMLILLNTTAVLLNRPGQNTTATEQLLQPPADEFSYTVASIYDIENTEP